MNESRRQDEKSASPRDLSTPRLLLHLEGAVLFAGATAAYFSTGGSWPLFLILLLAADLSMLGYLAGPRIGALVYDLFHAYPLPALLLALSYLLQAPVLAHVGLIWLAHIGMDRTVGYGLKYPTGFKDTHLQRL
ncbi:MAG TPA: DUF4260 domain-containing protein [Trueperaceae bacterium]